MPIYRIKCDCCGHNEEIFRTVAEYDNLPDHCGIKMQRVICAPYVVPDIQPYKSIATGEMITSRSKHKEHLIANNLTEIGNEKPSFKKNEMPEIGGLREELYARVSG